MPEPIPAISDDLLVFQGGAVKALDDASGKVGGYLVVFSTADDPDLQGEFFTKSTDFWLDEDGTGSATVLYDHGLDATIKSQKIGRGRLKVDDVGVWVEATLQLRDQFEKAIYELAKAGKLGWSSGTAERYMGRDRSAKSWRITSWPIVEASLTPIPVEPRSVSVGLKSLAAAKAMGCPFGEHGKEMRQSAAGAAFDRMHSIHGMHVNGVIHSAHAAKSAKDGAMEGLPDHFDNYKKAAIGAIEPLLAGDDDGAAKSMFHAFLAKSLAGLPADAQAEAVLAAAQAILDRNREIKALRDAQGRTLSEARRGQLKALGGSLVELHDASAPAPDPAIEGRRRAIIARQSHLDFLAAHPTSS